MTKKITIAFSKGFLGLINYFLAVSYKLRTVLNNLEIYWFFTFD
jgi:hypothetical protein